MSEQSLDNDGTVDAADLAGHVEHPLSSDRALRAVQPVQVLAPWHLMRRPPPGIERRRMPAHITCAVYSMWGEIACTYNDEDIYLFAAEASRGWDSFRAVFVPRCLLLSICLDQRPLASSTLPVAFPLLQLSATS